MSDRDGIQNGRHSGRHGGVRYSLLLGLAASCLVARAVTIAKKRKPDNGEHERDA